MKICVPATGEGLEVRICPVFGRAPYFVFVEVDDGGNITSWNAEKNPAEYARGGAGIMASQKVVDAGCDALITISIGPKAYDVLRASGVKVYAGVEASVKDNVEKLVRNELSEMVEAVPGRFGRGWRGVRGFGAGRGWRW